MSVVDYRENARAVKSRLWNPSGGRMSTELEIMTEPDLRKRRLEQIAAAAAERRERAIQERWASTIEQMRTENILREQERKRREQADLERGILNINTIIRTCCAYFNMRPVNMISDRRTADIVMPRQIAMYLCRHHTTASLPKIGRKFGGRDHTTVLYGTNKIKDLIESGHEDTVFHVVRLRALLGVA